MQSFTRMTLSLWLLFAGINSAQAETPGKDGFLNVASGSVVVNQYAPFTGPVSAGSTSITATGLATVMPGLAAGDLIMIYQAQGATISGSNSAAYGSITALNNAGRYEFQTVASVSGNTITFATYAGTCAGLKYSYDGGTAAGTQIIRVPQYRNLTVSAGGAIRAAPWNGSIGGVVAMTVSGTATINGTISAAGAGFRGGTLENNSLYPGGTLNYVTTDPNLGAEKGESIAGSAAQLPGGAYGAGSPANGGGGGDAHNAPGGGGANGDNGVGWSGLGKPDTSNASWIAAWNLDGALTATTNSSGGGRGGYTYGANNADALTQGAANVAWGGDNRRQGGGLGGRPLSFDRTGRIYFGGGGGAGDANDLSGGAGGAGGGVVFLTAAAITGSGIVTATGAAGGNASFSSAGSADAPGGGGGGGTILASVPSGGSLTYLASGGVGGTATFTGLESEGGGGGGGGGVIAVTGSAIARTASGGANGISQSASLTEFLPNGGTQGATGQPTATGPSRTDVPLCYAPPITVTKTSAAFDTVGINRFMIPAADVIYTITVTNPGSSPDTGTVVIVDPIPPELTFYNGDIDGAGPLTGPFAFIDGSPASGLNCCSAGQFAYSQQTTGTNFTYVPVAGYDPLVKRVQWTPGGTMNPGSTTATSFKLQFRAQIK